MFSSTRETRLVPGIGAMSSPCASSHARATCAGVASTSEATASLQRDADLDARERCEAEAGLDALTKIGSTMCRRGDLYARQQTQAMTLDGELEFLAPRPA